MDWLRGNGSENCRKTLRTLIQSLAEPQGCQAKGDQEEGRPVADPEGVWGMAVLRAADRAEALAIAERDPSITAGVNTFDVFEIMGGRTG